MGRWIELETRQGPIRGWRCDPAGVRLAWQRATHFLAETLK